MPNKPETVAEPRFRWSGLALSSVLAMAPFFGCQSVGTPADEPAAHADPGPAPALQPARQEAKGQAPGQAAKVVTDFIELGKKQLGEGQLEAARSSFAGALQLDPANAEASKLFEQVTAQLAEKGTSVPEIAETTRQREEVKRAQARLEAQRKMQVGEEAAARGDFDQAIRQFEDALIIVRWNPFLAEGALAEAELQRRIDATRRAAEDAARARDAEVQARALQEQKEKETEELQRVENQIKRLFAQANEAFGREHYEEAQGYTEEILKLDPSNTDAEKLRNVASHSRHQASERNLKAQYKREWRKIFDDLTYDNLPQTDLITFPSDDAWKRISERGPLVFSIEQQKMAPEDQDVLNKLLETKMSIQFEDTSLEDAVNWFRQNTGLQYWVSPKIADSGEAVTFKVRAGPLSAKRGLDMLKEFSQVPINWKVENGIVKIITAEEAKGGQILQIYDVRDLTKTISSFPSKDFNLTPSGKVEDIAPEKEQTPAPIVVEAEKLQELITQTIAPSSWKADPNNTISVVSGALVVRQTPEVHAQIDALLRDLRENAGTLINVETRFITVKDNFLEDIGVDFRGLNGQNGGGTAAIPNVPLDDFGSSTTGVGTPSTPSGIGTGNDSGAFYSEGKKDFRGRLENLFDLTLGNSDIDNSGGLALQFTYLDDTKLEAILRAVEKSETANIVNAPSLTVFNGQRANINVMSHVSYVRDYDVEIAQGSVVADPVVDVIRDGSILDVRPVVSADRRFITMELRPTVANLPRPIPTFQTSLGIGNDVVLQLPELEIERARTTVTIPDGATLMLGGLKFTQNKDFDSGLPWLKDIPIISFLVSRKGTLETKKKLLILVRASIVIPTERAATRATAIR
ncbi:MAG: hypothetical protein U1E76_08630 [Planctomycetota bacterium]